MTQTAAQIADLKKILKAKIATKDREARHNGGRAHPKRFTDIEVAQANLDAALRTA